MELFYLVTILAFIKLPLTWKVLEKLAIGY